MKTTGGDGNEEVYFDHFFVGSDFGVGGLPRLLASRRWPSWR